MKEPKPDDSAEKFQEAIDRSAKTKYILRLYVAGNSPRSRAAIENIHNLCEEHLQDRYQLEVIDIYQQPSLARGEQIIATPTLIKYLPVPLRRMIGDLTKKERILVGLDLIPLNGDKSSPKPDNPTT